METSAKLNEFDRMVARLGERIEKMPITEYTHSYFHLFDTLPPPDRTLGNSQMLEELVDRATRRVERVIEASQASQVGP
jgi:hypothetical protein